MNPLARSLAAIALAAAAAFAGARLYSARTPQAAGRGLRAPVGETSPQTAADLASPPDAVSRLQIRIPELLPRFTLDDLAGKPTSITAWRHKSLIINFWATWCAPCRREIPLLKSLDGRPDLRDFAVIGIAVDHRDEVAKFARQFKIGYPLLWGEQDALDVASALGVASPAFPFTVFTDRRGRIVAVYLGELRTAQIQLILGVVESLNDDRLALAAARQAIDTGLERLQPGRAAS